MVKIEKTYFYIQLDYQNSNLIKKYKTSLNSFFLNSRQKLDEFDFVLIKKGKKEWILWMLKWQHVGLTKLHTSSSLYSIAASMKYQ